ncbi:hypothetical protein EV145_11261 [Flavobacterium sp. 245]|nr:hypothetical protein EV145_11261 [Flavobacterium sp. 245]
MKEIRNTEKLILFEESLKSIKNIYRVNKDDAKRKDINI